MPHGAIEKGQIPGMQKGLWKQPLHSDVKRGWSYVSYKGNINVTDWKTVNSIGWKLYKEERAISVENFSENTVLWKCI